MSRPDPAGGPALADVVALEQAQVARAQAGDREVLRTLLVRHGEALFARVILPRVGDRAVAEDLLRATMVTAIEKLGGFTWQGRSIYFWLRQIALNKVIDHHRATQRGRRLASALANEPELTVPSGAPPGPEAALIARQEQQRNRERIDRALARINPRYRRTIELRLIEELPREACARQLEVTPATFDVLLFRALRAFRAAFGER